MWHSMTSCCTQCTKNVKNMCTCGLDKLQKEVWRLRLNWLHILLLGILWSVSIISVSSSFHQFVTNPRSTNGTLDELESGLGQSESFYSWTLAVFNLGSLVGAILTGFIVQCIPYWYLILLGLILHTVGYIIYAVTYVGWLIMISKFMSGYFLGAQVTLALSYASKSSLEYVEVLREMEKKPDEGTAMRVRNYIFALQAIGISLGLLLGPGATVIFAQFQISQFRSIAWFNVAVGIAFVILHILIFHGESSCKKITQCRFICQKEKYEPTKINSGPFAIFIILTLFIFRIFSSFRFGTFETLFNPVLSDSFGFNEKDASYFFFGISAVQIAGPLLLIILQKLKASSPLIAIVGILMTLSACVLITDWQAIPYDPCTEYSPFHHPELIPNDTLVNKSISNQPSDPPTLLKVVNKSISNQPSDPPTLLSHIYLSSNIEFAFASGLTMNTDFQVNIKITCHTVKSCVCSRLMSTTDKPNQLCLFYARDENGHFISMESLTSKSVQPPELISCIPSFSTQSHIPPPVMCIHLYHPNQSVVHNNSKHIEKILQTSMTYGEIQSLQVLTNFSYYTAKMNCIHANVTDRHCHWTPSSTITNKECEDCPPICRSREQTLSFVQFTLGTAIMMMSLQVLWVSTAALASNQIPKEIQGIVMGFLTAMTGLGRSISPLILDAAYEGMEKRTFVAMILLAGLHLPFLVEIIVFYRRLKFKVQTPAGYEKIGDTNNDGNSSDSDSERSSK